MITESSYFRRPVEIAHGLLEFDPFEDLSARPLLFPAFSAAFLYDSLSNFLRKLTFVT